MFPQNARMGDPYLLLMLDREESYMSWLLTWQARSVLDESPELEHDSVARGKSKPGLGWQNRSFMNV